MCVAAAITCRVRPAVSRAAASLLGASCWVLWGVAAPVSVCAAKPRELKQRRAHSLGYWTMPDFPDNLQVSMPIACRQRNLIELGHQLPGCLLLPSPPATQAVGHRAAGLTSSQHTGTQARTHRHSWADSTSTQHEPPTLAFRVSAVSLTQSRQVLHWKPHQWRHKGQPQCEEHSNCTVCVQQGGGHSHCTLVAPRPVAAFCGWLATQRHLHQVCCAARMEAHPSSA